MSHKTLKQRLLFPVLAVLVGGIPLLGLELTLRALGVAAPESVVDHSYGFADYQPLFVSSKDDLHFRTSHNLTLYFGRQQFKQTKSIRDFRMFFLGGSTVRGRPYTVDTAFAKWVELELNARGRSEIQYQSINCGGLSYASFRLARINREVLQYDPDLIVLATGHNEFLEDRTFTTAKQDAETNLDSPLPALRSVSWIRSFFGGDVQDFKEQSRQQLPANVAARLDAESGYASYHWDPVWRQNIIDQYRQSLQAIIVQCKESGTPVLFVCLGSNLRDCPPIKSELPDTLGDTDRRNWQDLFAKATLHRRDPETAIKIYAQCAEISDQHALLHYRMARCHELLGNPEHARQQYLLAKDYDICPLRLTERMNAIQHELATEHNIPLVNARQAIENASLHGIPGYEMYVDHVHPSIGGHQVIATAIVAQLMKSGLVPSTEDFTANDYVDLHRNHLKALPRVYFANGRRRVEWLEDWARSERQETELQPLDLRSRLAKAERLFGFAQPDQAVIELENAMQQDFTATPAILQLALRMQQQGHYDRAFDVLAWLHDNIEDPTYDATLQFARMVNAESRKDRGLTLLIYDNYFQRAPTVSDQAQPWHELNPDIVDRLQLEFQ